MANNTKYVDQKWSGSTPIDGEQLSANGYYTGEHIGTQTQGNGETAANADPYFVEHNTVRFGTITQDGATNANMPSVGVSVTNVLTGCTSSDTSGIAAKGATYTATYTATDSYTLPSTITVKIGGKTKAVTTDYTWVNTSGLLTILEGKITGDVEITVTATAG